MQSLAGDKVGQNESKYSSYRGKIQCENELEDLYPHNVTFYSKTPDGSLSLQEFEQFAVDRLKLLRIIERVGLTAVDKHSPEWWTTVNKEIEKSVLFFHRLCQSGSTSALLEARKYDHISHYILRLVYCRTEELRKWFITNEVEFFRFKFMENQSVNIQFLSKEAELEFAAIDEEEKELMKSDLADTFFYVPNWSSQEIYEMCFKSCLELVKNRRVYLRNGTAYVIRQDLLTIILAKFRANLSKSLAEMSAIVPLIVDEDERLQNVLSDFDKRHTGKTFVVKQGKECHMTVEKLEAASEMSFPLCMKSLYDTVKTEHHLKHFGRLQLGLFFKGLGLPLDEAIRYWRTHFTKKAGVDGSRFDKQYLYNIRHMYGQEGKRADYTPYSCMKIIMSGVGPGENHGCPFRHSDEVPLRAKLAQANIPSAGVKEIMELVGKHHYQIACQKYFEWTHAKATVEGGVNHPNQYFEESQNILSGKLKIKTEAPEVKTTKSSIYDKPFIPVKSEPLDENGVLNALNAFNDDEDDIMLSEALESIEKVETESESPMET